MSVTLAPMSSRVAVRPGDDPYKKYWWVILLGFGATGAWIMLPMMETSVGSTRIDTSGPAAGMPSESSLDSSANPNGAPGSTLDLSMELHRPKRADGSMASSLYQAPEEDPAAAGVPEVPSAGAAAAGGTLASALAKAASSDPTGWGGQKAQKGFSQPKLGGSMPGLGGGGGGSSGASAGGGSSAFGSRNAQVGFASTQGLKGGVQDLPDAKTAKGALVNAAAKATQAANLRSKDGQVSGLSSLFDGRSQKGGAAIGGDGGEAVGSGGIYGSLDASPSNLKLNDPNLDSKEFKEVPAQVANTRDNSSEEFKQQLAMMVVTTLVGGLVGGVAGGMITSMGTQLAQMWQTQQRSQSQLNEQNKK